MLRSSDTGTEFVETAMLPFHLAMNTAVAMQSMAAAWFVPYRLCTRRHEQLAVPAPIEEDDERCLFA